MINEDGTAMTTTGDMAQFTPPIGGVATRGLKTFDIDTADEFHSFAKGQKKFREWKKHTKSQEIRQWANKNYGKSFMVHHNGNYIKVNRSKVNESIEETYELIVLEAIDFKNRDGFINGLKDLADKLYKAEVSNNWEHMGMYGHAFKNALTQGKEFLDDKIKGMIAKLDSRKWKDSDVLDFSYFIAHEHKFA
jgi:hypothetical protein